MTRLRRPSSYTGATPSELASLALMNKQSADPLQEEEQQAARKRVLIIDDHRDSADMMAALLRALDRELVVAVGYDGEAAVSLARGLRPTAVIIDLELPRLGGAEAAAKIRTALSDAPPLLIAFSGNFFKVAKAQQGTLFDHAFVKPVDGEKLLAIVRATPPR